MVSKTENTHAIINKNGGLCWQGKGVQVCSSLEVWHSEMEQFNLSKENVAISFNVIIHEKSSQISPPMLNHF